MMIFLCFSSNDRYTIVESVLYHLKNYGLNTWYDYHRLILGDDKFRENLDNGVKKCKYAIWILSRSFYTCECGQMELKLIKQMYEHGQIHIFPILYNLKASELPCEYVWVRNLIYNELTDSSGSLPTCNQIVSKILKDEIDNNSYIALSRSNGFDEYSNLLISTYYDLDERNLNSKITTLYCLYKYMTINVEREENILTYSRIMDYLFKITKLNLSISFKELIIAEQVVTIMINSRGENIEYDNR